MRCTAYEGTKHLYAFFNWPNISMMHSNFGKRYSYKHQQR